MTPKLCAVLVSLPLLVGATGARAAGIVQNTTLTPTAGISLDTIIFRPDNAPRPVLVARAGGATRTSSIATQGDAAINAGYVFVYQQMRGFSPSTGNTFTASLASGDPLNEGDDGRSLLTWIKSQSWSNGHVAIQGASHSGIAADLAAPGASPPLTGLDEEYATDDLRHQGLYQGGVIRMDIANVLTTGSLTLLPSWETWATEPSYIDDDAQIATIGAVGPPSRRMVRRLRPGHPRYLLANPRRRRSRGKRRPEDRHGPLDARQGRRDDGRRAHLSQLG